MSKELLRQLPQVEKLLQTEAVRGVRPKAAHSLKVTALRTFVDDLRARLLGGDLDAEGLHRALEEDLAAGVERAMARLERSAYRHVINASGIILHTGLGRAVLPAEAVNAVAENLRGYSLVEVDTETGDRNHRESAVASLLCAMTGGEAATVVNNNAAATMLILAAAARDKEVIISRGQLVEIGGSFRVPEILEESGATLVEVGATNRTYIRDYERAITENTGLLLQVHTSNYAIKGFHHETPLEELVALGKKRGIAVASDLGSGCFVDLTPYGFEPEPLVTDRVRTGADLVCVSGDKLLGGPQAGIIIGRAEAVRRVRAHPLFRALRVDKLTLSCLEAALRLYREPETLNERNTVLRLISAPAAKVEKRAAAFLSALGRGVGLDGEVVASGAQAGSGALPAQEIPSYAVALTHGKIPPLELARRLRTGEPPVFARVHNERLHLDFRTVLPGEETELLEALKRAVG